VRPHRPFLVLAAALAAAIAVLIATAAALHVLGRDPGPPGPPFGAVLDAGERRQLAAVRVLRGVPARPADPSVDLTDSVAVARAYLALARADEPGDRGRTRLRAAGYALPGSPPAAVGVLVLDAPEQARTAEIRGLELVAADPADTRRGYRADVARTIAGTPGTAGATTTIAIAYVVLARQPDGRWLVTADTSHVPDGDA
jgi:hypothetical protein